MVTYRTVKKPETLKPIPFEMADILMLGRGEEANVGTDLSGDHPTQLNCRYADNTTYVHPTGPHHSVLPWKFTGYVSPEDCRAWYKASVEPKEEPAVDPAPTDA
ncbi:MAG: hypothetical protein JWQ74_3520 [Marmoricola sp.]|nr:hypothetical protein [Marmoricola sp.]